VPIYKFVGYLWDDLHAAALSLQLQVVPQFGTT